MRGECVFTTKGPSLHKGKDVTVEITPEQVGIVRNRVVHDFEPRQDSHAAHTGVAAKSVRIIGIAKTAISVQVQPACLSCIGGCGETVGVGEAHFLQHLGQRGECTMLQIIIDALQCDDIGSDVAHQCGKGRDLRVFFFENVAQQQTWSFARQLRVECRDADVIRRDMTDSAEQDQRCCQTALNQAACKPSMACCA